ncbi:MAG: alanine racemase [Bacteroidota bacterium]
MIDYIKITENLKNERAPFAFIDLDALKSNITTIDARARGKKVRIATKSIRSRWVLEYIKENLESYFGLMTFSPEEALWLAQEGFDNILMGYPTLEEGLIRQIFEAKKEKDIVFMVDTATQIELLNKIAEDHQSTAQLCVDIDLSSSFPLVHFGVHRSPLKKPEDLKRLLNSIKLLKHIVWTGLMGYEAQIAGVGDQVPGQGLKSAVIRFLKSKSLKTIEQRRTAFLNVFEEFDIHLDFVNGGGTGSMESTGKEKKVTEITVGSGFLQSHLFDYYEGFTHQPAAYFALRAVRQPNPQMITVMGGGYIASGATDPLKQPQVVYPKGLKLTKNEGAGEVQTPLILANEGQVKLGDLVVFRHAKAGEVCERFEELIVIEDNKISSRIATYRGENKCFL